MNNVYTVKIEEVSRELSAKERIMFKDTTNAIKLDELTQESAEKVIVSPAIYGVLAIHNEKSEQNKDYKNFIIIDKDGTKYVTSSESFWNSFKDIADEMGGETEEWSIEVYRVPSKNFKGKEFLNCSIM